MRERFYARVQAQQNKTIINNLSVCTIMGLFLSVFRNLVLSRYAAEIGVKCHTVLVYPFSFTGRQNEKQNAIL